MNAIGQGKTFPGLSAMWDGVYLAYLFLEKYFSFQCGKIKPFTYKTSFFLNFSVFYYISEIFTLLISWTAKKKNSLFPVFSIWIKDKWKQSCSTCPLRSFSSKLETASGKEWFDFADNRASAQSFL